MPAREASVRPVKRRTGVSPGVGHGHPAESVLAGLGSRRFAGRGRSSGLDGASRERSRHGCAVLDGCLRRVSACIWQVERRAQQGGRPRADVRVPASCSPSTYGTAICSTRRLPRCVPKVAVARPPRVRQVGKERSASPALDVSSNSLRRHRRRGARLQGCRNAVGVTPRSAAAAAVPASSRGPGEYTRTNMAA